ncbi:MAG: hypothetical protein ACKOEV_15360 [Cytophagales bacterium]
MKMLKAIVNLFRFDRTNWRAAFLCILTALVFWFFNALNKSYSTDVRFPLRFDYNLEKYVPIETLPNRITLNVNGTGWELFREYIGFKQPELTISLDRPTEVKKLAGVSLTPVLQPQVGKLKINYIVTDTLKLQLDEIDSHRFKIFADAANVTYQQNFGRVSPVMVVPDSVELIGPKSILGTLPDSLTVVVASNQLNGNFEDDIEIVVPSLFVKRSPPQVKVMFEVGRVVELYVNIKSVRKENREKQLVDSIGCRLLVPEKRLEDFHRQKSQMGLRWDANQPKITNKPEFVEVLHVDTVNILQP